MYYIFNFFIWNIKILIFFIFFKLNQVNPYNLRPGSLIKSVWQLCYKPWHDASWLATQNIKMILNEYFTGSNLLDHFRKRLPTCGPWLPLSIQEFHDEIIKKIIETKNSTTTRRKKEKKRKNPSRNTVYNLTRSRHFLKRFGKKSLENT